MPRVQALQEWLPRRAKAAAKQALLARPFGHALREISALQPGEQPQRSVLTQVQRGWSNEGMAADTDYLEEVARWAVVTPGPVLECGSGLTTVLLGILAGRRGVQVWSLEHIPEWRDRIERTLRRHNIANVTVCLAPLRSYDSFSWYDPPNRLPPEFALVVCDGPPDTTPGGRYGLVPVVGDRLRADAVILLDDATRAGEAIALRRWASMAHLDVSLHETPKGAFARVSVLPGIQ